MRVSCASGADTRTWARRIGAPVSAATTWPRSTAVPLWRLVAGAHRPRRRALAAGGGQARRRRRAPRQGCLAAAERRRDNRAEPVRSHVSAVPTNFGEDVYGCGGGTARRCTSGTTPRGNANGVAAPRSAVAKLPGPDPLDVDRRPRRRLDVLRAKAELDRLRLGLVQRQPVGAIADAGEELGIVAWPSSMAVRATIRYAGDGGRPVRLGTAPRCQGLAVRMWRDPKLHRASSSGKTLLGRSAASAGRPPASWAPPGVTPSVVRG